MRVAFFSAVRFDSIIGGRTKQLALEIASTGHDVWFVEMPSLRNLRCPPLQIRQEEGIDIVTIMPFPFSHKLMETPIRVIWCKMASAFLKKQLAVFEETHCIVSTPWWAKIIEGLPFKTLTYDFIDHVSVHCRKAHEPAMRRWEKLLLRQCNNIFIIRDTLKNEIKNTNAENISLIPNGVPAYWLETKVSGLSQTGRPQIGFVGSIYEWIDQELVCSVAQACPEMDFVLVGPTRKEVPVCSMQNMANITLKPPLTFDQVPNCMQSFDVCIIPFKQDVVSNCADPLKLYEYLALGKPVVSSVCFNSDAPVYVGQSLGEFIAHIKTALNEPDHSKKYREFASKYTWQKQARKVIETLESKG